MMITLSVKMNINRELAIRKVEGNLNIQLDVCLFICLFVCLFTKGGVTWRYTRVTKSVMKSRPMQRGWQRG